MLIVSKFHDFYDVGMKMGIDKTVVYERNTTSIKGNFPPTYKYYFDGWQSAVLGFCGKFYPFVFYLNDNKIVQIIWNLEEALITINPSGIRYWDDYSLETESGIKKFFDRKYPQLEDLFHKHKTPVFVFEPPGRSNPWTKEGTYRSLVIDPSLKNIKFYKIKDPITAFQEIHMFISGVIGVSPKLTKPIDDKTMAASKGHDGPYSFRKPPGKRGKNRWR